MKIYSVPVTAMVDTVCASGMLMQSAGGNSQNFGEIPTQGAEGGGDY
ncbi:MAG: hypothetical protein II970_05145 [Paludibacteraceae bacterium]|nr:hypothetical protein [Paludibacteraceae bacterium]